MIDFSVLSIKYLHEGYAQGTFTCADVIKAIFERINQLESKLKAFITLTEEQALEKAVVVDKRLKSGEKLRSLEGIPYCAKDVFCTKGVQSTGGSGILEGFVPPYNATAIDKIDKAGAILIGKNNCDPF